MLFGREEELALGEALLTRTLAGRGGVFVCSGEPGIGKSSLVRALADRAESLGARVAVGRAWEAFGAPAYFPIRQACLELDLPLDTLLGNASGEMADASRLVAFDRVARALADAARTTPIVIVLDDLHAADVASLELAVVLARGLARQPIALLATTREVELSDAPERADLLAKLGREGTRVSLRRLTPAAVGEWLASAGFAGDRAEVMRVTEGNPLFIEEAVRVGVDRFAELAAGGVAGILAAHIARLGPGTRELLSTIAVLGREAELPIAASLAEVDVDRLDACAREGARAGVLRAAKGRVIFAHVLLRDALYDAIEPSRRAALHARAADLADARAEDPATVLAHRLAGADHIASDVLVRTAVRAAEAALSRHAPLTDVTRITGGVRARLGSRLGERDALALDLVVADATMRSDGAAGRELAARAAETARRLASPIDEARAALVYGMELVPARVDPRMVRILEGALAVLPETEIALRARVLARLASALIPPSSDEELETARRYADLALRLSLEDGRPETRTHVLRFVASALGYSGSVAWRVALISELMGLVKSQNDELTQLGVGVFFIAGLIEVGRVAEAREELERYRALVARLPVPQAEWRGLVIESAVAALDARYDDARALGEALAASAERTKADHARLAWALLHIALAVCDGDRERYLRVDDRVVAVVSRVPTLAPWLACAHALAGRTDAARAALAPVVALPRGFPWLVTAGQVVVLLEDADLAARFYPLLDAAAFRGRFFWGPAGTFPIGPTSRILAELALLTGDVAKAEAHLAEAVAQCRASEARSLLALCDITAARIASRRVAASVADAAPPAGARARQPVSLSLSREGDVWRVNRPGAASFSVKHAKGLEYLSALLATPGQEHFVLSLAGATEAPEDAGPVLDERARAAYRERVRDLEETLAEAERDADRGRMERARDELDRIAEALAGAVGLGGRDRKAASNVERARINVQRRIKDAIRRIGEHDADLARYLDAAVRTGTYCAYVPVGAI